MCRTCISEFIRLTRSRTGFSLINLMVGVTVTAVALPIVFSWFSGQVKVSRTLDSSNQLEEVRNYLRMNLSCAQTFPSHLTQCNPYGGLIAAKNSQAAIIVAIPQYGNYTRFGNNYALRAQCLPCATCTNGYILQIDAAETLATPGGTLGAPLIQVGANPVWTNVFPSVPLGCVVPP